MSRWLRSWNCGWLPSWFCSRLRRGNVFDGRKIYATPKSSGIVFQFTAGICSPTSSATNMHVHTSTIQRHYRCYASRSIHSIESRNCDCIVTFCRNNEIGGNGSLCCIHLSYIASHFCPPKTSPVQCGFFRYSGCSIPQINSFVTNYITQIRT